MNPAIITPPGSKPELSPSPADPCAADMPTNPATMPPSAFAEGGAFHHQEDTMDTCKFCDMIERVQKERGGYVASEHACELFEIMKAEYGATDFDDAAKILHSLAAKIKHADAACKRLADTVDRLQAIVDSHGEAIDKLRQRYAGKA